MSRARTMLSDESGFTLIELMTAMIVGIVVLLGAFTVLDIAVKTQHDAADRTEALANGRQAMETMTREIRSQVCLGRDIVPITTATDTQLTFYASLAPDASTQATLKVQQRTLAFVPSASDPSIGRIDETVTDGVGTLPNVTFPAAGARTRTIATNIAPVGGKLFRYWKFDPTLAPQLIELTTRPVPTDQRALTVQVGIQFESVPSQQGRPNRLRTLFDSKVYVRTADPTDPERSPKCI